jgi:transcription termination/antitermination protein NusA
MNNEEVLEALRQIAREKNVTMDLVIDTLEEGLLSAARKKFGTADNIDVDIDQNNGDIVIWSHKAVVEDVEEPALELNLKDAKKIDPTAEVGEAVMQEIPFTVFGRMAIQSAKQMLVQKVREAERMRIYETFHEQIGEIRIGTTQQILRGDVIVNLGRAEGILPTDEQIPGERFRQGDTIRGYVRDVMRETKGPQVILSRKHPVFLERLFQLEVPEIYDGLVEIMAVARDPGNRAKVAVTSHDERIDPVGACIGPKGSRVQAVVRELNNERIDIILWSPDPLQFLLNSLAPAEVDSVIVEEATNTIIAIATEDQLSPAIGRGGQNVRLASMLSGWRVEVLLEEQYQQRQDRNEFMTVSVDDLPDITAATVDALKGAGVESTQALVEFSAVDLQERTGLPLDTTAQLLDDAQDSHDERREEYAERMNIPIEMTGVDFATFVAEPPKAEEEVSEDESAENADTVPSE